MAKSVPAMLRTNRGWNRKEGRAEKDFKKKGKLGQGVGALKRGSRNALPNYVNNKRKNIKGKTKKVRS